MWGHLIGLYNQRGYAQVLGRRHSTQIYIKHPKFPVSNCLSVGWRPGDSKLVIQIITRLQMKTRAQLPLGRALGSWRQKGRALWNISGHAGIYFQKEQVTCLEHTVIPSTEHESVLVPNSGEVLSLSLHTPA